MTLSFTQTIDGKPNYFIEKIWSSFPKARDKSVLHNHYSNAHAKMFGKEWDVEYKCIVDGSTPKIHTIRFDPHNRWRAGMLIHPVINNRTLNRFQFAPTIPCRSVQRVDIKYSMHKILHGTKEIKGVNVFIDGIELNSTEKITELAINDGFDSVEAFFAYFKDGITDGSLIHWTDKRY